MIEKLNSVMVIALSIIGSANDKKSLIDIFTLLLVVDNFIGFLYEGIHQAVRLSVTRWLIEYTLSDLKIFGSTRKNGFFLRFQHQARIMKNIVFGGEILRKVVGLLFLLHIRTFKSAISTLYALAPLHQEYGTHAPQEQAQHIISLHCILHGYGQ